MGILRVREAFSVLSDPSGHVYTPGELVDSAHPHVKAAGSSKFETVEAHVSARSGVEFATAEPGSRRMRSRAAKQRKDAADDATPKATPDEAPTAGAESGADS